MQKGDIVQLKEEHAQKVGGQPVRGSVRIEKIVDLNEKGMVSFEKQYIGDEKIALLEGPLYRVGKKVALHKLEPVPPRSR
jgi:hypothetical protein